MPQSESSPGSGVDASGRPQPLEADHPALVTAAERLRRIQLAWAALFLGMGLLVAFAQRESLTATPLLWLATGVLLLIQPQPAYLAVVAALWGLSLVSLNSRLNQALALDPIALIFVAGTLERLALAFVRIILLVMAWNQFLFYRMLYGTEAAGGLDPQLRPIPEVVPNRANQLANLAAALAGVSLVPLAVALSPVPSRAAQLALSLCAALAALAIGLGLGAAFSPTRRRGVALLGLALGSVEFLMLILLGQTLAR